MRIAHLPRVNARYWSAILLASLFGTNLGDLYAHEAHLGIVLGTSILAALAACVFVAERRDGSSREWFYWLVIIIIRTGATNIADYSKHAMPYALFGAILIVLLVAFAWASARADVGREAATEASRGMPATGTAYWLAMLTVGVFGTFYGDVASHFVGQGIASLILGALLAVALAAWRRDAGHRFWLYWLALAVARSAGTAMGDFLAEDKTLAIGLPPATLITGIVFVLILALWPRRGGAAVPIAG